MFLYLKNIFKREAVQKALLCRSEKRLLLIEVSILQNKGGPIWIKANVAIII